MGQKRVAEARFWSYNMATAEEAAHAARLYRATGDVPAHGSMPSILAPAP